MRRLEFLNNMIVTAIECGNNIVSGAIIVENHGQEMVVIDSNSNNSTIKVFPGLLLMVDRHIGESERLLDIKTILLNKGYKVLDVATIDEYEYEIA